MSYASTLAGLMVWAGLSVSQGGGPPFELQARQDRLIGGTNGTLIVAENGVEFRTADASAAHQWDYPALKQVRLLHRRLTLETYEDQGRLRLGRDRTYTFDLTEPIPAELAGFLLERIERPVVTAVMPPRPMEARFRVPVKHGRAGRGSEGLLLLYDDGLAYLTDGAEDARFWRFRDLFSVLALDRYRLEVRAYEGGSGETRPFIFELKETLPPGMYDALWQHVNTPPSRTEGGDR